MNNECYPRHMDGWTNEADYWNDEWLGWGMMMSLVCIYDDWVEKVVTEMPHIALTAAC